MSATSTPTADLDALLAAQRAAFLAEEAPDRSARRASLDRLRGAVLAHRGALESAAAADFGHRSPHETALMELASIVQTIDYLKRRLRSLMAPERRRVAASFRFGRAYVTYQPLGVVGIISPWNYPFALALVPLATALAAGNRAMLKPSEHTPHSSALLKDLIGEAFDPAEVAVVTGDSRVGIAFAELPFDHLFFTGSTAIGREVMRAASNHLVPVTLELGGKSPVVVARGAVDDRTVSRIVYGKLANAGQTCVAPDYAFVHEDDIDAFIAAFDRVVKRQFPGGPTSTDYTSVIDDRQFDRLLHLLEDALLKGARIVPVGHQPERAASRPRTLAPSLVVDVREDMRLLSEEIFGPLLPILPYRDSEEVIAYINARPRPLALYYFGKEDATCRRLLASTTSGNVGINNTILHVAIDDLPFGGVGASGMGAYHGIEGFRTMSHARGIYSQGRFSLASLARPPYGRVIEHILGTVLR
ncbi:coniferyl aldehyde dehydrogenase [Pleomorphomonas diazotrophica]|uniref:Aldehyde dehydrogenase n=1 Tax=Pleomorphomonas diazotrophica TaxID=1166257 RepID=A0A1I4S424_9HYPH|nr:coniferyl aldehyde dehydrogenase [Pleomorphomonas diazotrophica]SFM59225.1 coniferyl-aldehyde dehydrogenase [Pleomorphomonas diazotrophica]